MLSFACLVALSGPIVSSSDVKGAAPGDESVVKAAKTPAMLDVRANAFVSSTQSGAALAATPDGGCIVAWQSRRQTKMAYAIFAQRFDATGAKLGDEAPISLFEGGAQTGPSIAVAHDGALWFAWESYGQDGDQGAILARRFESGLTHGGSELLVNVETTGHQAECSIAGGARGDALVAWTGPGIAGGRSVFVRVLAASMECASEERRIDVAGLEKGSRAVLPSVARDPSGGWIVAWAQADAHGVPRSILACELGDDGAPRAKPFVLDEGEFGSPVEAALAMDVDGSLAVGAFAACDGSYAPFVKRFERGLEPAAWTRSSSAVLPMPRAGAPSGFDLAFGPDRRLACVWSSDEGANEGFETYLTNVERDGVLGETRPATSARAGHQRLSVGASGRRVAFLRDGALALAWNGDAQLGDSTGVHLSIVGDEPIEPSVASDSSAGAPPANSDDGEHEVARPHEPPVRVGPPPAVSGLVAGISGPDFGFSGLDQSSLTPPDPLIAVGPNHVMQVVNPEVAWFTKSGALQTRQTHSTFFQTTGLLFDAEVIFDPHSQRFMYLVCNRTGSSSLFHLAVSDDDDPNGAWARYTFDVTALALSTSIDSPNLGVDAQSVILTADFPPFTAGEFLIFTVDKAPLLTGAPNPVTRSLRITTSQSWGTPVMQTAAPAYYFIEGLESPNPSQVVLHALTDPLGTPSLTSFPLAVPAYTPPADPPQQGTTVRPETFEARFWSCTFINGKLYATHHQGSTRVLQRWYEIDMANWPVSGAPTLLQSGDVDLGAGVHTFFGSIAADSLGAISLTYARSSPTEFISAARSLRLPTDPLGTLRPSVLLHASSAPSFEPRWGDYSGCVTDPASPGTFWGSAEHFDTGWRTWIARWEHCQATAALCVPSTTTNGCAPSLSSSGVPSATASNGFTVTGSSIEGARSGSFFYGVTATSISWTLGSSSVLCVAAPYQRMPLQFSGGAAGSCDGVFILDWNAWRAAHPGALGSPFMEGQAFYLQAWFRDPPALRQSNLSNALSFALCP